MAHALEQKNDNRLVRPVSQYVGGTERTWTPVGERAQPLRIRGNLYHQAKPGREGRRPSQSQSVRSTPLEDVRWIGVQPRHSRRSCKMVLTQALHSKRFRSQFGYVAFAEPPFGVKLLQPKALAGERGAASGIEAPDDPGEDSSGRRFQMASLHNQRWYTLWNFYGTYATSGSACPRPPTSLSTRATAHTARSARRGRSGCSTDMRAASSATATHYSAASLRTETSRKHMCPRDSTSVPSPSRPVLDAGPERGFLVPLADLRCGTLFYESEPDRLARHAPPGHHGGEPHRYRIRPARAV